MESIPKDVMELVTNKLSPQDFLTYCSSDINKKFCDKEDIWRRRFEKDYGFLIELEKFQNYRDDPKKTYLELSKKIFTVVEEAANNVLKVFGNDILKYLSEYKKALHEKLYDHIIENLKASSLYLGYTAEEISDEYFGQGNYNDIVDMFPSLFDSEFFSDYFLENVGYKIEHLLIDTFTDPEE